MKLTKKHLEYSDIASYEYVMSMADQAQNFNAYIKTTHKSKNLEILPGLLSGTPKHMAMMDELMKLLDPLTNDKWSIKGCESGNFANASMLLNVPGFLPSVLGSTPLPRHIPSGSLSDDDKSMIDEIIQDIFAGWTFRSVVMPRESGIGGFDMLAGAGIREALLTYAMQANALKEGFALIDDWAKRGNPRIFHDLATIFRGAHITSTWRKQTNEKNGTLAAIKPKQRNVFNYLGDDAIMDRTTEFDDRFANRTRINQAVSFLMNIGEMIIQRFVTGYDSNAYGWSKTNSFGALWLKSTVMPYSMGTDQSDQDKRIPSYISESLAANAQCLTDTGRSYLALMSALPQIKCSDLYDSKPDFTIVGSFFNAPNLADAHKMWRGNLSGWGKVRIVGDIQSHFLVRKALIKAGIISRNIVDWRKVRKGEHRWAAESVSGDDVQMHFSAEEPCLAYKQVVQEYIANPINDQILDIEPPRILQMSTLDNGHGISGDAVRAIGNFVNPEKGIGIFRKNVGVTAAALRKRIDSMYGMDGLSLKVNEIFKKHYAFSLYELCDPIFNVNSELGLDEYEKALRNDEVDVDADFDSNRSRFVRSKSSSASEDKSKAAMMTDTDVSDYSSLTSEMLNYISVMKKEAVTYIASRLLDSRLQVDYLDMLNFNKFKIKAKQVKIPYNRIQDLGDYKKLYPSTQFTGLLGEVIEHRLKSREEILQEKSERLTPLSESDSEASKSDDHPTKSSSNRNDAS